MSGQEQGPGQERAGGNRGTGILLVLLSCALALALGSWIFKKTRTAPTLPSTAFDNGNETTQAGVATLSHGATSRDWSPPKFKEREGERDVMVDYIRDYYNLEDDATLAAMRMVPRHEFVPADEQSKAYDDSPLPIPNGQLISQPWIVADMTSQLQLKADSKVLEIGTGSGYQAAVLSCFTSKVFTIEIIRPLAEAAAQRLARLGYTAVHSRTDDGFNGWPEEAPFDAIIVTCAAGQIPPPLIQQLKPGGRMMIPVGGAFAMQSLMLVEKDTDGAVHSQSLAPVRFVPLLEKDPTAHDKSGK